MVISEDNNRPPENHNQLVSAPACLPDLFVFFIEDTLHACWLTAVLICTLIYVSCQNQVFWGCNCLVLLFVPWSVTKTKSAADTCVHRWLSPTPSPAESIFFHFRLLCGSNKQSSLDSGDFQCVYRCTNTERLSHVYTLRPTHARWTI